MSLICIYAYVRLTHKQRLTVRSALPGGAVSASEGVCSDGHNQPGITHFNSTRQMHTHTHTHTKFPGQISVLCRFQTVPRAIKLNLSIHLTHFPRVDFDQRFHFLHYQLLCIYAHTLGHFICVGLVISHQLSNVSPQSPCAFRVETVGHIFLSFCHLCCLSLVHFNIVF